MLHDARQSPHDALGQRVEQVQHRTRRQRPVPTLIRTHFLGNTSRP